LYASPLSRAFETATIIGRAIGRQPDPLDGFAEIDPGDASGLLWTEWAEKFPVQAAAIQTATRSPFEKWAGGESGQDLADRVFNAWDELVTRHLGTEDVVTLVSHGGPLAWIAARLHDDPLDVWPTERAGFRNCSISELLFEPDGSHTFVGWNETAHLDDVV
jgi:probable phosphoglycerate mutase